MMVAPAIRPSIIEWGTAGSALAGPSGDAHVVAAFPDGVLVAVIDGLGHGEHAATAARAAAAILEAHAGDPVFDLVQRCHADLRDTRGVALTLASFDVVQASVTEVAVGNVEGELLRGDRASARPRVELATCAGVVGYRIPRLRVATHAIAPGDLLILATDGLRPGFATGTAMERDPLEIAETILASHAKGTDDALVLVARYLGVRP